jgi:hypothetical protein
MKNWIEIGSADELSAVPARVITLADLKRVTAMNREFAV